MEQDSRESKGASERGKINIYKVSSHIYIDFGCLLLACHVIIKYSPSHIIRESISEKGRMSE